MQTDGRDFCRANLAMRDESTKLKVFEIFLCGIRIFPRKILVCFKEKLTKFESNKTLCLPLSTLQLLKELKNYLILVQ
jgi:hypothetical protein